VEYERRFHETPDPIRLLEKNPAKGTAFFQIDTFRVSLEMKIMIWRILMGCDIVRVQFTYESGAPISLSVVIKSPYGDEDPPYVSTQGEVSAYCGTWAPSAGLAGWSSSKGISP
jgi:hypothetical protein